MKIAIEPDGDVDVLVTFRYNVAGAPPIEAEHTTLKFWPERVVIRVRNGNVDDVTVTGHHALLHDQVGVREFKRTFIREDFADLPLWLRNASQVSALDAAVAGLVP